MPGKQLHSEKVHPPPENALRVPGEAEMEGRRRRGLGKEVALSRALPDKKVSQVQP